MPTVQFENVRVGLGDYLSDVLAPVTTALRTYLTYYKPYLALINAQIPGLNTVFNVAGLGDATILNIANILKNTGAISDPIFDTVVQYSDLLSNLDDSFGDLTTEPDVKFLPGNTMINIGSFDLGGNGDLRSQNPASPPLSAGDLSTLVAHAPQAVNLLKNQLGDLQDAQALQAAINRLQTDISLTFPFTDDPVHGAFAMLLGHDVPLVKFTVNLPSLFNVQLADFMKATGAPKLGLNDGLPATAELGGDFNLDVYLSGGYDTRGLRELIADPNNIGALADGFYFDSSKPILSANGDLTISGGPKLGGEISVHGVTAKGEVGVEGVGDFNFDNLTLAFDDPNLDGDHTFRPFSAEDSNRDLFAATGSLRASLSVDAYAEAELKIAGIGFDEREVFASFGLDLGTFFDFNSSSYNKTNPFRPANAPPPTDVTVEYDFAAKDPFLANDNGHDDLYAYVLNDTLIVSLDDFAYPLGGGLTLYSTPMHPVGANGVRNTVTKLILMGGEDGTTFHVVNGPAQYQIIGQGIELPDVPGREQVSDILDVSATGFGSDRVVANMGGTGTHGVSDLNVTSYQGNSVVDKKDFVYSHLTGLNVDLSLTPRDIVNINAASTVPVDLNLSKGDDNVTIDADYTADDLAQHFTIHGNGGNDTLTFRKSQPTKQFNVWDNSLLNKPIDAYTVDDHHLTYQTQQITAPEPGPSHRGQQSDDRVGLRRDRERDRRPGRRPECGLPGRPHRRRHDGHPGRAAAAAAEQHPDPDPDAERHTYTVGGSRAPHSTATSGPSPSTTAP